MDVLLLYKDESTVWTMRKLIEQWSSVKTLLEEPLSLTIIHIVSYKVTNWATVNDADKVLSKYGINLVDTSGKMRDVGTVLDEIGAKWDSMTNTEQNKLAYVVLISYNMK